MNETFNPAAFDEYLRQGEPDKAEKVGNWQVAIGLQAVDGLKTSDYLLQTAWRHIEGEIDIDTAGQLLRTYYQSKTVREPDDDETEQADLVARNIAKILSTRTLDFSTEGYIAVHRKVFDGVFKFAGKVRDFDITKREWVLRGDTVNYLNHEDLRRAISYDIEQEREFSYKGLSLEQSVEHLANFVSGLWQIHAFQEGNTRTTAVFCIQYLRSIGFNVGNEMFARYSWYFRNALVRANYKNAQRGIDYDFSFLNKFFRNLLMGENNELKNRYMVIDVPKDWENDQVPTKYRPSTGQAHDVLHTVNHNIVSLVSIIGEEEVSVKYMMEALAMKHRRNFTENYLQPSIDEGFVRMLYPNSPKHPRQKYLLTVKGLAFLKDNKKV